MKLTVTIAEDVPDIVEKSTYRILNAESVRTDVHQYQGVRVSMEQVPNGDLAATMLWVSDTVSPRSKLGAFIGAFGADTDEWKDQVFNAVKWRDKEREIKVIDKEPKKNGK